MIKKVVKISLFVILTVFILLLVIIAVPKALEKKEAISYESKSTSWEFDSKFYENVLVGERVYSWLSPNSDDEYFYEVMNKTGVNFIGWINPNYSGNWTEKYCITINKAHSRGYFTGSSLSNIWSWQEQREEPAEFYESIIKDPYGNDLKIFNGQEFLHSHSSLSPIWKDYLQSRILSMVDCGVDVIMVDEMAYGGSNFDFKNETLTDFNKYLKDKYSKEELKSKFSIEDVDNFNYSKTFIDYLPREKTSLTLDDYFSNSSIQIPLRADYDRFRTMKNKGNMVEIIEYTKKYSLEKYNREIIFSANLNNLGASSLYFIDLLDYVDLEILYFGNGYPPEIRAFPILKIAEAFGKKGIILTSYQTDLYLSKELPKPNFFKTIIADSYSGGGYYYVEEKLHDLNLPIDELAPYFKFPTEHKFLFENQKPKETIGILYLWESQGYWERASLEGLMHLLADSGYQFGIVFGAEDTDPTNPAPPYVLSLDEMKKYPVLVVPKVLSITEKHAKIILDYAKNGGILVAFATENQINSLSSETLNLLELKNYLLKNEAKVDAGKIMRIEKNLPEEYYNTRNKTNLVSIKNLLSQEGFAPGVEYLDDVYVGLSAIEYSSNNSTVVHLVNFNYNLDLDSYQDLGDIKIKIAGNRFKNKDISIIHYNPENPDGEILDFNISGNSIILTVPEFEIWDIVYIKEN